MTGKLQLRHAIYGRICDCGEGGKDHFDRLSFAANGGPPKGASRLPGRELPECWGGGEKGNIRGTVGLSVIPEAILIGNPALDQLKTWIPDCPLGDDND